MCPMCYLRSVGGQLAILGERLDSLANAASVGRIPSEILAPLIPQLDATFPPLGDAIEDFQPIGLDPWVPPWRTAPPIEPEAFAGEAVEQ